MLTLVCGGFGAARLLSGLREVVDTPVCCIVNTADDLEYAGLQVCPDLDSVLYALGGEFDEERGFGRRGDTFRCNGELARYGAGWFSIGDEDMALHLERTRLLHSGMSLSEATAQIAAAWRCPARLLPMSDDPVRTVVQTDEGLLSFADYLVRRRASPRVTGVQQDGIARAAAAPGVLEALREADVVLIAPSNPVSSVGPVLALPGVRESLSRRRGPTVAVTPVVSGREPRAEPERVRAQVRAALLAALGFPHRAAVVAGLYAEWLDGFVLDHRDAAEQAEIGVPVLLADTLAKIGPGRAELARAVLEFAHGVRVKRR
ncbi:MAG: 2-phospho-L-lactate transferase [Gaiellaceae bacterium]